MAKTNKAVLRCRTGRTLSGQETEQSRERGAHAAPGADWGGRRREKTSRACPSVARVGQKRAQTEANSKAHSEVRVGGWGDLVGSGL